jgi:hypothetical protein
LAASTVSAPVSELPALREQPSRSGSVPIPPRFLRHADEQTVIGLAAVLQAMEHPGLADACYRHWGVVAAPVFPGRLGSADTFTKYRAHGAAVVSPHTIPQYSLHSLSSAISICLGVHGPSFGVGGGQQALAEGFTAALSLLEDSSLPGLWLVLTRWSPEPMPDGRGSTCTDAVCIGTAIALAPGSRPGTIVRLTIPAFNSVSAPPPGSAASADDDPATDTWDASGLAAYLDLTRALADHPPEAAPTRWSLDLPWGGRVELVQAQQEQTKAA